MNSYRIQIEGVGVDGRKWGMMYRFRTESPLEASLHQLRVSKVYPRARVEMVPCEGEGEGDEQRKDQK